MHKGTEDRDWNEGEPDHEGEMAVSQLHRVAEMASMLLNVIGKNDDLPGWIQYKFTRAYNDLNDAFNYIESKSHDLSLSDDCLDTESFTNLYDRQRLELFELKREKRSLWKNIRDKRARGEKPAKPGEKGYPDQKAWKKATKESIRDLIKRLVKEELKK